MNEILQKRIDEAAEKYAKQFEQVGYDDDQIDTIEEAIIYGAILSLQNQWIPVSEALPKCDRCHFAMYEDGGIIVAKYENETWWWQDGFVVGRNTDGDLMYSSSCEVPSGLITHWMPIPQIGGEK